MAEIKGVLRNAAFPFLLDMAICAAKAAESFFGTDLSAYGIIPRKVSGIPGIFTSIFIHADWKHLFNNSLPLFLLSWALVHFYREVAFRVSFWVMFMGGFWTWISAREASHIGASGLLYGLFSFLLISGFIRFNKGLLAISFLAAFTYGSLVWGILPYDYRMSWESHFWGFTAGIALAIYYRKVGTQREVHLWNEAEEALLDEADYWKKPDRKAGTDAEEGRNQDKI